MEKEREKERKKEKRREEKKKRKIVRYDELGAESTVPSVNSDAKFIRGISTLYSVPRVWGL